MGNYFQNKMKSATCLLILAIVAAAQCGFAMSNATGANAVILVGTSCINNNGLPAAFVPLMTTAVNSALNRRRRLGAVANLACPPLVQAAITATGASAYPVLVNCFKTLFVNECVKQASAQGLRSRRLNSWRMKQYYDRKREEAAARAAAKKD